MLASEFVYQFVKWKIVWIDKAIDRLVYELYGLSEGEIAIVEGRK